MSKLKHVIITQAKDESIRLTNWIAYHSSQGIDGLIFVDDFSTDSTSTKIVDVCKKYSVDLDFLQTDRLGESWQTGDSDTYHHSTSLHNRIVRSFSKGLSLAKVKYGDCVCYFIDVDEYVVTSTDIKISQLIENILLNLNIQRIYCHSFDVRHDYKLDEWITKQPKACYRWGFDSRQKSQIFSLRGKSICLSSFITGDLPQRAGVVHDLGKSVTVNEDMYDFNKLRIHHFRIPNLSSKFYPGLDSNYPIEFCYDDTLFEKTKDLS